MGQGNPRIGGSRKPSGLVYLDLLFGVDGLLVAALVVLGGICPAT